MNLPGNQVKIYSHKKDRSKIVTKEQFKMLQENYVGLVEWCEHINGDTGHHFKTDTFSFTLGRDRKP